MSPRLLGVSMAAALLLAAVLLAAVVLPAAHGLDPVGLGAALGTLAADDELFAPSERDDTVRFTLPPGGDTEYKLYVRTDDAFSYDWFASDFVYADFHGEEEGAPPDEFTSFQAAESRGETGTHNATFTGTHGWYWRNPGSAEVTITLRTEGVYAVVGFL